MNNNLTTIKLKGACFYEGCKLDIFSNNKKHKDKLSVIYGKNGSGKSSITNAIYEYKKGITSDYSVIEWFDKDSNKINFSEEEKEQIFVYNEDYIEQNIKIDADGLKSIVMFGEQISLDEKIQTKENERDTCEKDKEKIHNEDYENFKNVMSPKYHQDIVIATLKENNKWADEDAKIKKNKNKSAVRKETINDIVKHKSDDSKENIKLNFKNLMLTYDKVSENNNKIVDPIKKIKYSNNIENNIIDLLAKKIEEPLVNDKEKRILAVIQNGGQKDIESIKEKFEKEEIEFCPYCFQTVTEKYKSELINSIQKIFNKDVEDHKEELEIIQIDRINLSYKEFELLDKELIYELQKQIKEHNDLLDQYQKLISNKKENIFTPILAKKIGLENNYIMINELLETLEEKRITFNKNIDNSEKIKNNLLLLNKQLAWFDIKKSYETYIKQDKKAKENLLEIEKLSKKEQEIKKDIISLKAKKSNVKIALDKINRNLEYIFFSKNRLTLGLKGGSYCIKSKGKDIKLKNLSIGERNIISLCYFFSKISDNCEEGNEFKNECLIVLDDPISSFDFGNKIGIYSFLRNVFNKVFINNENSRILVFSHELEVIFNIQQISSDIGIKKNCFVKILDQNNVKDFGKNKNDYGLLLEKVYKFADEEPEYEQLELTIGNVMRRVLEAFSTFTYKKGMSEISCDKNILNNIKSETQRNYFENLMYRLVLNGESHSEERSQTFTETSFYEYIAIEEKVRTAKDILVFLYLLNPQHIKSYLSLFPTAILDIENWSKTLY